MVDEEFRNVASELRGSAPVNRDKRDDPEVIEGEVTAPRDGGEAREPTAAQPPAEAVSPPSTPPANASNSLRAVAAGALAGLIVAALAAGGGYYLFAPKADLAERDASRLAALQTQAQGQSATLAGLDKRLRAVEASNAENRRLAAAANEAAQRQTTDVKGLSADLDAARHEIPGLLSRIAKLESGAGQSSGATPDLSTFDRRLDKIEAALAAPKSESRAAPEQPSASDNAAAIALVAEALEQKLSSGVPIEEELGALERLGVGSAQLAALKAVVNGAPTGQALAASFDAVAPKVLAAASHAERGGIADRFLAHIRGLVHVRDLKETGGDDPAALISQIEAACRRDDVSGALAAFGKLPEAARQLADGWAAQAGARRAADAAVQSIRKQAIARLTGGAKP